jgi:hypothetical protein
MRSSGTDHLVILVGAVGMHRRSRHFSQYAEAATRQSLRRRIDNPPGIPTRTFRRSSGAGRLLKTGARKRSHRKGLRWRYVGHCSEGLGCARGEGLDGEGLSRSAVFMRRITPVSRGRGATRRWPPRARSSVSSEGRWTPLRRPCGRLSGRRETMNVRRQKTCCLDGASCRRFCKKE